MAYRRLLLYMLDVRHIYVIYTHVLDVTRSTTEDWALRLYVL